MSNIPRKNLINDLAAVETHTPMPTIENPTQKTSGPQPIFKLVWATVIGAILLVVAGSVLWSEWKRNQIVVLIPKDVTLKDALLHVSTSTPKGWHSLGRPVAQRAKLTEYPELFYNRLRRLLRGTGGSRRVPNTAREIDLVHQFRYISQKSQTEYLLAKEFMPSDWDGKDDSYWLCFVYGGVPDAPSLAKWIALNEAGIVEGGIRIWRKRQHIVTSGPVHEPYLTNKCVLVRDKPGTVKIVPLEMLGAYRDAGLLELPAK